VDAKSKGSETNLAQILYSVGNQNINGMRCPLGFSKRALPHFRKDDNSSSARGYVLSSFY
jgi:DNA-directed RNA polymerase III subunit RPC1